MKKIAFIAISLSISVLLSLIVAEVFCRIFIKVPVVVGDFTYPIYRNDNEFRWVLKRSFNIRDITTDENGFRTFGSKIKDKADVTILTLGDSHTFGMGVPDDKTYPAQLETTLLNKYGRKVGVINAGIPGYNTKQAIEYGKRLIKKFSPDIVLLGIVADDIGDIYKYVVDDEGNLRTEAYMDSMRKGRSVVKKKGSPKSVKTALKKHSHLIRIVTDRIPGLLMKLGLQKSALDQYLADWANIDLFTREELYILEFSNYLKERNISLVVIIFPLADQLVYNRGYDVFQDELIEFTKSEEIQTIDLVNAYRPIYDKRRAYSSLFIYNDGHPNENGHKVISEYTADYLIKNNLIESK